MRVGIDPGLTGAIAFVDDENNVEFYDMPVMPKPWNTASKYKSIVDNERLFEILSDSRITKVNIELVTSRSEQGITSTWEFSGAFHSAIACTIAAGHKPNFIRPQKWKSKFNLIAQPKDMARRLAIRLYPFLGEVLGRKKDVGRADAFFISLS